MNALHCPLNIPDDLSMFEVEMTYKLSMPVVCPGLDLIPSKDL